MYDKTDEINEELRKDPMDRIARDCGWLPLTLNESMTVTFYGPDGKKVYTVRREE